MADRLHQLHLRQRFKAIANGTCTDTSTLIDVCPGGGKSQNVTIATEELRRQNLNAGLIWFVPRASLAAQSRKNFNAYAEANGMAMRLEAVRVDRHGHRAAPARNTRGFAPRATAAQGVDSTAPFGFVTTYQRFTSKQARNYARFIAEKFQGRRGIILLALDELHHCTADDGQAWTRGVRTLRKELEGKGLTLHFLNMSGTLYRKDQQDILNVVYENGEPRADVSYSLVDGRSEKAVIPPEVVFVDGPVVIKRNERQKGYDRLQDIPASYRAKVLKAFLTGTILKPKADPDAELEAGASVELGRDSREVTSLWLLGYGIEHFLAKREELNYPLQTIVVAHSAAAALGYTGWLRRKYPQVKTALSLSAKEPSDWGHAGFSNVLGGVLTDLYGNTMRASETLEVCGQTSENSAAWYEDPQCSVFGVPKANYNLELTPADFRGGSEWEDLPYGEKVIRAFQSPPVDGENVVDVLVTVGKAYEGLDAPRCSHLICLARHRSAPWLSQCFARSWRYDYELAKTGVEDQRCWIFVPADALMVEAIDRIVWSQPLAGTLSAAPGDNDLEMDGEDSLEEQDDASVEVEFVSPDQLEAQWQEEQRQARIDEQMALLSPLIPPDEFGPEGELDLEGELDRVEDAEQGAEDEDPEATELPPEKPPVQVKAFNIIDRVRHEFVNDAMGSMELLLEKKVEHQILV